MRLGRERPSENIEDRRGMGGGFGMPGGGMRIPIGGRGGIGIGGIIVLLLLWLVFGINPLELLSGGGGVQIPRQTPTQTRTGEVANDQTTDFSHVSWARPNASGRKSS